MSALDAVVGSLVVLVATALQAVVGFGGALVAAPVLTLVDPTFVPAPLVLVAIVTNATNARREGPAAVDGRIRSALVGYVPGMVAGAVAVAVVSARGLSVGIAVCTLLAVMATVLGPEVRPTRGRLGVAGAVSGFTGTVSGIGGPPIALLLQREAPPTVRATMAVFFRAGAVLSFATLVVVGAVGRTELVAFAALVPGMLGGAACARPLLRRLGTRSLRPVVLGLSTAASLVVLTQELL